MSPNHSASLTLTVHGGDASAAPRSVRLDHEGGTIGRAPDCTIVLADPQRNVSRLHARIDSREAGFVLIDCGSNPTVLNERVLDGSREAVLQDGDRLRIGAYVLEVSIDAAAVSEPHTEPPVEVPDTLMTRAAPATSAPPAWPEQAHWDVKRTAPLIPDDWDLPKDEPSGTPFFPDPLAAAPLLREPAPLVGNANQALLDALTPVDPLRASLSDSARRVEATSLRTFEHVSPEQVALKVPTLAVTPLPAAAQQREPLGGETGTDPLRSNAQAGSLPSMRWSSTFSANATASPIANAVPTATRAAEPLHPAAGASPEPSPNLNPDATATALLEGLAIDPNAVRHIPAPELARLAGAMLREATQGAMSALRSRSMAKRETRIAMTLIEERDNNPLKFFPDVDAALTQMLASRGGGYLAPRDALHAAFHDIQAHELAVVAGMRAALAHAMARIEPAAIEKSLDAANGIDALLGNRRARLWQRYVDTWEHVARDAGDDFHRTFGEPFSRAYQAQLDALDADRE
ncbi:FHA domain protein [Paraburkholderia sp. RAU2J]|uniref:type VI secretion system-associated FHA domain protein TagH n=1 Tax=Paraburkholderia sp. RAU2J TaxID=1938810 RepID=UPI000EABE878|nr:type VI secretion system-associated FHA domain protein TagH [Paraburkholderia sp. RAU2J]RKT20968.1 FHA domain protein [Paraburkholderia sp. RAU2J]